MTHQERSDKSQDSWAYIVRIWRSGTDGRWHFSVQNVTTGERHGFGDLDSFLAHFYTLLHMPTGTEGEQMTKPGSTNEVDNTSN